MATIYLRSTDGSDSDDGSDWANAKATLQAAVTAAGVGGTVYVSQDHDETMIDTTFDFVGTALEPVRVLCVNDSGSPGSLTTGAKIFQEATISLSLYGHAYIYGLQMQGKRGLNFGGSTTAATMLVFDTCVLLILDSNQAYQIRSGNTAHTSNKDSKIILKNTQYGRLSEHEIASVKIRNADLVWEDTPSVISSPTKGAFSSFVDGNNGCYGNSVCRGLGLEFFGEGTSLVTVSALANQHFLFENCRLGSGVALTEGDFPGPGASVVELVNCHSSNVNYDYAKVCYEGSIFSEITNVRNSGATDGTTSISRKMVSSSGVAFFWPLTLDCMTQWNEDIGSSKTATIHVMTDNVTLTNAECWMETEYLGSGNYPISSFINDRVDNILSTPANQDNSSETWNETDITTAVKQKLEVSFTPQMKGPVRFRVALAKPDTTIFVCPKVEII